jgi:TolA-binding protein
LQLEGEEGMKLETIVTAIIFLSVGFLAGFFYKAQKQTSVTVPAAAVNASAAAPVAGAAGMAGQGGGDVNPATGLPPGHPSLQVSEIIKNYQQSAEKDPKNPEIPLRLANYLYDQKLYNLAIPWYQRTLSIDPKNINARTDLGTAYFYTGQPQDALREYQKTLKISPDHQPTMFNMIVVNLEGTHDFRTAQKYWKELDRRNPNYPGLESLKEKLDAALRTSGKASATQ